jgi:hypothetical protein
MAVNKAFVVKNSLEVNQTLILADSVRGKVGIGTSLPGYLLDVAGGIGATNIYASGTVYTVGVATFLNRLNVGTNGTTLTGVGGSVGVGTSSPRFLLDVRSPVSTGTTALYAQGDARVTGNLDIGGNATLNSLTLTNITVNNQTTTQNLAVTGFTTFSYLNITGVATFGTVRIVSGIVTATSGVVTYYGDGSKLSGVIASGGGSIGIQSGGATVGTAITTINFVGIGLTASQSSNTSNVYLPAPGVSLGLAIALGG